jgi:hypothetical protein
MSRLTQEGFSIGPGALVDVELKNDKMIKTCDGCQFFDEALEIPTEI